MKPQRPIPEPWASRMVDLGFEYQGRPSTRALAERAGVTVNAALRVIHRENFGDSTAIALGSALQDSAFVADWVSQPQGDTYTPPPQARHLTPRQRNLVDELIRELAQGESDAGTTREKSPGGGNPEPVTGEDGGSVVEFPWLTAGPIAARRDLHGKKPRSDGERNA